MPIPRGKAGKRPTTKTRAGDAPAEDAKRKSLKGKQQQHGRANNQSRHARVVESEDQKRRREEQELALEGERASAADEDVRARALAKAVASYTAAHASAGVHIARTYEAVSRVSALRMSLSPAEVAKLRSAGSRKALKPDMKKGTGMSKRVTGLTEETVAGVLKDVGTFALGRYAGEIAMALGSDPGLRATELEHAVAVAAAMQGRYPDFTPVLLSTVLCAAARAVEVASSGEDGAGVSSPAAKKAAGSSVLIAALKPLHAALTAARSKVSVAAGDFGAAEGDAGGVTPAAITSAAVASVDSKDSKAAATRLRTLLRFLLELAAAGVYSDTDSLLTILLSLLGDCAREAASIVKESASGKSGPPTAPTTALSTTALSGAGGSVNPFSAPAVPSFLTAMPGQPAPAAASTGDASAGSSAPSSDQLAAPAVSDDVAARAVQVLPFVGSLLRSHGEQLTGRLSRKSRTWLSSSPRFGPSGQFTVDPLVSWAACTPVRFNDEPEWMREDKPVDGTAQARAGEGKVEAAVQPLAWPYAAVWADALRCATPHPCWLTPLGGPTHAYAVMAQAGKDMAAGAVESWFAGHPLVKLMPSSPGCVCLSVPCPFLSAEQQGVLTRACDRYFDAVSTALLGEVRGVLELEARARLAQFAKGGLGEALELRLSTRRAGLERLLDGTRNAGEAMDRDLPPLPTEVMLESDEDGSGGGRLRVITGVGMNSYGPFDDPAEASFYRGYPTLESAPRVLLDPEGIYGSREGGAAAGLAGAGAGADAGVDAKGKSSTSIAAVPVPDTPIVQQVVVGVVKELNPKDRIRGTLDSALGQLTSTPVGTKITRTLTAVGELTPSSLEGEGIEGTAREETDTYERERGGVGHLGEYSSAAELREMLTDAGFTEGTDLTPAAATPVTFKAPGGDGDSVTFSSLMGRLGHLGSATDADQWAQDFIFGQLNSRSARARLLRSILQAGRLGASTSNSAPAIVKTDALPFLARLVAVLDSGLPEQARLAPPLGTLLEEEFRQAMRRGADRGPSHRPGAPRVTTAANPTDARYRSVRLMSELVKFSALPPAPLFRCAKKCVDEASLSSLSVLSVLIETTGRHLFLRPDTNDTVTRMMEALKRIKEGTQVTGQQAVKAGSAGAAAAAARAGPAKPLTGPIVDLVDSMLFTIQPPERLSITVRMRPPMEAFVRYVMLERKLSTDDDVDELLKLMRKLPWSAPPGTSMTLPSGALFDASEEVVESAVVRCLLSASRLDGSRIELLMSVLAGLKLYHDRVAVRVVDAAIDRILTAIEEPSPSGVAGSSGMGGGMGAGIMPSRARQPSRVLGAVRILGHAYNYKLCDGPTLVRVLYMVINTGHGIPKQQLEAGLESANAQLAARAAERAVGVVPIPASRTSPRPVADKDDDDGEDEQENLDLRLSREMQAASVKAMDDILDAAGEEAARARAASNEAALAAAGAPRIVAPPADPSSGGWGFHALVPCAADPPGDTLRARIVTAMLETSGEFFCRGAAAARMDRFLAYFARYLAARPPLPLDTAFAVADAVEAIRPHFRLPGSGQLALSRPEAEVIASKLELEELCRAAIDDVRERVEDALGSARSTVSLAAGSPAAVSVGEEEGEEEEEGDEEEEELVPVAEEEEEDSGASVLEEEEEEEEEEGGLEAAISGGGPIPQGQHPEEAEEEDDGFDAHFSSFVREQADAARRNAHGHGGAVPMRLGAAPAPSVKVVGQGMGSNVPSTVQFQMLTRKGTGGGAGRAVASGVLSVPASEGWVQHTAAAAAVEAAARDEHKRATLRLVQEQVEDEDRRARMSQRWSGR